MKRLQLLLALLILSIVSILGVGVAAAHNFHSGNNVSLANSQPINQTVFAFGNTIDVSSEVFGDVICAGQTVNISGTVHGDIICAGQTVNITGNVIGDIRLAGQSVSVNSAISDNASIVGQSFALGSKGTIGGDVTLGVNDANLNGAIGRDVAAAGDTLVINGQVGRNIEATVTNLKLTNNAQVNGNIALTSMNDVSKSPGAVVTGKTVRTEPSQVEHKPNLWAVGLLWTTYCFLAMLVITLVLTLLFPRAIHGASNHALPFPWKPLGIGFVATIIMPFLLTLIAVTIVGLPLAFIGGLLWIVALILSGPLTAYWVGRLVMRRSQNALLIALVGAIVLGVLYFIPFLNFLVFLATIWIGTGMLLQEIFDRTSRPSYQVDAFNHRKKIPVM